MQRQIFLFGLLSVLLGIATALLGYIVGPKYLILLAGCLLFALFFLRNPEGGLLLFIFFLPLTEPVFILNSAEAEGFNLHWALIFLVVFCGIFFILAKRVDTSTSLSINPEPSRRVELNSTPVKPLFLTFLAVWLASFVSSNYKLAALRSFFSLSSLFFLYGIFSLIIKTKAQIKRVLLAVVFSSTIPIVVGLWQYLRGIGILKGADSYIFSIFENSNDFSMFIMVTMPAYLVVIFSAGKKSVKGVFILFLFLAVSCLYLAHTRTVLIATVAMASIFPLIAFRKKAVLPLAGFLSFLLASGTVQKWLMPVAGFWETSFLWRLRYWRTVLAYFLRRPVFGYGLSSSAYIMFEETGIDKFPHNVYLKMAFELGMTGLIFYLAIIGIILWQTIWVYKKASDYYFRILSSSLIALLAGWIICGLTIDVVIRRVNLPFFCIMCALIGASKRLIFSPRESN